MKYYIDTNGALFAYELDGSQDHLIPEDQRPATDAEVQAIINPGAPPLTKEQKIIALEATVTPRRIREAVLGTEEHPGWLANVNAQIAALRAA